MKNALIAGLIVGTLAVGCSRGAGVYTQVDGSIHKPESTNDFLIGEEFDIGVAQYSEVVFEDYGQKNILSACRTGPDGTSRKFRFTTERPSVFHLDSTTQVSRIEVGNCDGGGYTHTTSDPELLKLADSEFRKIADGLYNLQQERSLRVLQEMERALAGF